MIQWEKALKWEEESFSLLPSLPCFPLITTNNPLLSTLCVCVLGSPVVWPSGLGPGSKTSIRKMNYELDLTHGEVKWTCGQIFKLEVITYLWIWILDSFGIIPTCLSKYFTGSKSNYSKQIYLCYAIYNPQLLYSPRKWIHFKEVKMTIFFTEYQVRITKGP
jgi:hypothetical protein